MSDEGYSGAAFLGAVILTIWLSPVALIAALLLMRGEPSPRKRSQLRVWAWISGLLVAIGVVLVVLSFA